MDPYASPLTQQQITKFPDQNQFQNQFRHIVISWEKLRVFYNLILLLVGVVSLFFILSYQQNITETLIAVLCFGIFANLCFFAGPVCELYLRAFRNVSNAQSLRFILFSLGTIISLIPIGIAIAAPSLLFV